ncbi:NAD(P)-binding protein [Macrolepiota fuliginosa MF-IS2]|uniref:NAD(P)-binding protein n=1 Tax=Macrolepiota fuliginosa MF-IS2 TaxID=1400762 RepID=A0A9P5XPZ9_9AGAR|nr:NAD(P)-binding protein [Macrolepiota fuliginosa MF-IS2]
MTATKDQDTAIITGASSGIGRATAIALSKANWNVVLIARRVDQLRETESLCSGQGKLVLSGDITDEEFVKRSFRDTLSTFGRLDLVFNNAGIAPPPTPIEDLTLDTFRRVLDVNLVGPFLCTREAVQIFKIQDPAGGRIINNGSLSAHVPRPHTVPYVATKHAITGLTKSTALDGRKHNITCTQIDIGNASSVLTSGFGGGALQPDGRMLPEPCMDVQHVADTIVYIANLPNDVTMLEVNIMAAGMPFVGRG